MKEMLLEISYFSYSDSYFTLPDVPKNIYFLNRYFLAYLFKK